MTGHHLVPVHCFMDPGEREEGGGEVYQDWKGYHENFAPCICTDKAKKGQKLGPSHEAMHTCFDQKEDDHSIRKGKKGTWTYAQAREAAAICAEETFGCKKKCIEAQLDEYHKNTTSVRKKPLDQRTLRADSRGKSDPATSLKVVARGAPTGLGLLP
jgi:hypothetical protein